MIASCQEDVCLAREYELSLKTAQLEIAYERSLAQLDSLIAYEETRISRVDYIIFEADHELLRMKCEQSEYDIDQLLQVETALKQQLLRAQEDLANLQLSTLADTRAIQDLKSDLTSMKRKVSDYEKMSADKLNLTKEIAQMKQEFERLQHQNKSHQNLIAEKSALERQLNSLEIQLKEERRAFERNRSIEDKKQNSEAQQQLKRLQAELQKETDERSRLEQEINERTTAWEQQKKSLEERLEKLRKQLRSTKEKLKEYQEQQNDSLLPLEPQQIDRPRQSVASDRSASLGHSGGAFNPPMTIATPGAVKIATKTQRPSAALGKKSGFSITPYLKRNRDAEDFSSSSDDDLTPQAELRKAKKRPKASPKGKKTARFEESQPYSHDNEDDNDGDGEAQRRTKANSRDKSIAEDSILSRRNDQVPSMLVGASNIGPSLESRQVHRKRKVLGGQRDMTLFDDEDEQSERPKRVERPIPSLKPSAKHPQALGVTRLAFGEASTFSPLKRDKRRVFSPLRGRSNPLFLSLNFKRFSSSKRWQSRQRSDIFTREAVVRGLKSRAAFKLLQIDEQYRIFRRGQTVVDLGYAPGSWSQVAVTRTKPNGRVLGVDIIPAQPPKGVSTIQGNFLSPDIQEYVLEFVRDPNRGRPRLPTLSPEEPGRIAADDDSTVLEALSESAVTASEKGKEENGLQKERTVDVVLSDMSAPWAQVKGFSNRSLSNPYRRMMNTSGISFRDHAGSMDLCRAALQFSFNVLKPGGHFVCKFYQGPEDKVFEKQLKALFEKVHRLKPESSRSESREAFFVAMTRKPHASRSDVLDIE
ncbi:ftsj, putative [Talaromyces stipitatus ATCC 10500]|uniref:rRNA methyltransferase 2, mitochondrial n=1 Tax=Talaromyces stipitatus (strain ATCC 10500 / CBS 375.48 / QM 6759 / NRRL 1006) TaxID=441959 RepID=B8LT98_TALSN|nr:ftsj, putative [Talaromyces stipitatus ATCC 10500]EED23606.1 ftsj, putative [Talaromyces stipitatus ATCC 10500]